LIAGRVRHKLIIAKTLLLEVCYSDTNDLQMKMVWPRMNTKKHERFAGANGVGHELYEKHEKFADENSLATNEHENTQKICWRKWGWPRIIRKTRKIC
jgi:hypothetical protein